MSPTLPSAGEYSSPDAQRPITNHLVHVPSALRPRNSISTQVPVGVYAFHELTDSSIEYPAATTGDVHVPVS